MRLEKLVVLASILFLSFQRASAAHDLEKPLFSYDLTLYDLPFNSRVGAPWENPSMRQSLGISGSIYQGLHAGLQQLIAPNSDVWWERLLSSVCTELKCRTHKEKYA